VVAAAMVRSMPGSRSKWRRRVAGHPSGLAVCLLAIAIAGCSSDGAAGTLAAGTPAATSAPSSGAASEVAPTQGPSVGPVASGPATFQLTAAGDAKVTGTWGPSFGITCLNPTYTGTDIIFFAASPDGSAVVLITLAPGSIAVSERAGQGATYTERDFQGSGVTSFDPSRGSTFDSDVTPTGGNPGRGTLGSITHVSGSVACGDQTAGASTITLSGAMAAGGVAGPFARFRVQCNTSSQFGQSVNATAIVIAGSTPTLLIINLPANLKAMIFSVGQGSATNGSFAIDPNGTLQVGATGAHLDANFIEVLASGVTGPAHRIHLAGDMTCGTFASS